jgi:hypothetical protein
MSSGWGRPPAGWDSGGVGGRPPGGVGCAGGLAAAGWGAGHPTECVGA